MADLIRHFIFGATLGGFMAVCWTDFFQDMLMVCAIVFTLLAAMKESEVMTLYDSTVSLIESIDPQMLDPWTALTGGAIPLISNFAWAGFRAAFGSIILFSLFLRKTTRNGTLGGMLIGGLTVILWKQLSGGILTSTKLSLASSSHVSQFMLSTSSTRKALQKKSSKNSTA